MKILSIGNSFSQDAQRYLHEISKANGYELLNVNLYIGGCPLKKHYLNMLDDEAAYGYEVNGQYTGLCVSIRQVLKSNDWDYITFQQASHESFKEESYTPYLEALNEYVKKYCPKAKIYIHQTWAYPEEMTRLKEVGFETTEGMFGEVQAAYHKAASLIDADGMILSGEAMLRAYKVVREKLYRDAIHAGLGFGRYLLGIVWFHTFFGEQENFKHITEFDADVSDEEKDLAYKLRRAQ